MIARTILVLTTIAFAVATAACGSSSGGNAPSSSTCTSTFDALCQRACSCGGGGKCTLVIATDAGVGASIAFNDLADCENLYGLGCGMAGGVRADFDYAACTSAAASAVCIAASGGGMGVAYPPVCDPNAIDAGPDAL